ncbi:MAG: prolipoprotein diacylglyceryl transferase family protein [Actinomycetota bacterium]
MYPTLFEVAGIGLDTHGAFIALGLLAATVLLFHETRRRGRMDQRMIIVALGALLAAGVTSRLGTGIRYLATTPEPTAQGLLVEAGRSLLGGLVGAYVGVEVTKRLVGIRESTGDLFAPGVALGLAIGRIGCLLTEQLGTPTSLPWGVRMNETGVERGLLCLDCGQCPSCNPSTTFHPSFLYEIVFHAVAFVVLWRHRDDQRWRGRLLARYLVAYAIFRFFVEFVRGNLEFLFGLTGSQLFILATTAASLVGVAVARVRRARRRTPSGTDADGQPGDERQVTAPNEAIR